MKKGILAVAGLSVAAAVSVGSLLYVKSNNTKENQKTAENEADKVLFELDSKSIGKVEIIYAGDHFIAESTSGEWVLTDDSTEKFSLNQETLTGICTYLSNLTADQSYGEINDENKAKYGLTDPYTVIFYDENGAHTLCIGDISPTGDYYYAYTDSKNKIYAITANTAQNILTSRMALKNSDLVSYDSTEIVGMEVKRNGQLSYTLTLDTATNLWKLPEIYSELTVNQTKPGSMLALISRLSAEVMIEQSDDDVEKYGFDAPDAEVTVKGSDDTEETVLLRFYGKDTATYIYAYLPESKQVEIYYTGDLDFIDYTYFDFIMQNIECANVNVAAEVEITSEDFSDKFTVNTDESKAECRGTVIDLSSADIRGYFDRFYNSFTYIRLTDIKVDAQPDIADSIFTAKYTTTDGIVKVFDYVPDGSDYCFVFIDGKYTGTRTSSDFISGSENVKTAYELLCRQAGINAAEDAVEQTTEN